MFNPLPVLLSGSQPPREVCASPHKWDSEEKVGEPNYGIKNNQFWLELVMAVHTHHLFRP